MNERKRKIADYAATFCVNVAAIGTGIAIFNEDKIIAAVISAVTFIFGAIILWRVNK